MLKACLLGYKVLLHDHIVEVAARVDCSLLVQSTLLHVVIDLVNQVFPHL